MQIVYVPIGVGTYHMPTADAFTEASIELLHSLDPGILCPEKLLLTTQEVDSFLKDLSPDLVILQNVTFANAAYTARVLQRTHCPVVLWTLREPKDTPGSRLKLNALTGAFSAANQLHQLRDEKPVLIFGGPDEESVALRLRQAIAAAKALTALHSLKIASIGQTPQGFGFGRALDADLLRTFGCELISIEARELMTQASACEADPEPAKDLVGLEETPENNTRDFLKLYQAYRHFVEENGIGALASRCWPDFFVEYGTPVCSVLSLLNAEGIPSACEGDVYGALSMFLGQQITGESSFFGDPVALDEEENTFTFWHCGMAACNLAREESGACVGVHPNRKIGPTMEFGLRSAEEVTLFRVGRDKDGTFRFFIAEGKALDRPKQYLGTSVVVQMKPEVRDLLDFLLNEGYEPHYAVIYGAAADSLEMLGRMLGLKVDRL